MAGKGGGRREEEHEECESGPSNRINPRPVNPFIGAANPATGYEREGARRTRGFAGGYPRRWGPEHEPKYIEIAIRVDGLTTPITVL